jgi:hypothetical protein
MSIQYIHVSSRVEKSFITFNSTAEPGGLLLACVHPFLKFPGTAKLSSGIVDL